MGIALDHWSSPRGAVRRGGGGAREPERARVLARVRAVLREPPSPAALSRGYGPGANHLSALAALGVVEAAADDFVREQALVAAEAAAGEARAADRRLVEALGKVARDADVPLQDRVLAVEVLGKLPGADAVDAALVRATRCPEVEVQAAAASGLTREAAAVERHRALLEELSAAWPVTDAPWQAARVRDALRAARP
ncbi:hypothetical protein [Streptomyces avicenniae]|uniref:hypothetical protein n=1 Tax=Streptomyces avicenniae TaxID=500153 RepID=UPI00069B4F53|nr:hypothetical protein [Streptomyces avicenniae]